MAGWLDVLVMSELLQYNRGRDTAMKHRSQRPMSCIPRVVVLMQHSQCAASSLAFGVGAGSHRLSQRPCIPPTPCFVVAPLGGRFRETRQGAVQWPYNGFSMPVNGVTYSKKPRSTWIRDQRRRPWLSRSLVSSIVLEREACRRHEQFNSVGDPPRG